jgi:hypothetical protein
VKHLKIFGSLCYKHVPDVRRSKLDDKSESMIFTGYHSTGAYKLCNPRINNLMLSRDLKVIENEAWDWKMLKNVVYTTITILSTMIKVNDL